MLDVDPDNANTAVTNAKLAVIIATTLKIFFIIFFGIIPLYPICVE